MPDIRQPRESETNPTSSKKDMLRKYFDEGMKAIPKNGHTSSNEWVSKETRQGIINDLSDVLAKHKAQEGKRLQASLGKIGDSLLQEQRKKLDSILPAPRGGESIQAFPYMGDLPAANLPAVSQDLSHSPAIERLVSNPVGWKSTVDTCEQSIQNSAQSLGVEYDFSTQYIQRGLQEVSHYLDFVAEGGHSPELVQERYRSIDSSLTTIRTGVALSENGEIKTTTNDFLHSIGIEN